MIFCGDLWGFEGETGTIAAGCWLKKTGFGSCEGVFGPFRPSGNVCEESWMTSRLRSCIAVLRDMSLKDLMGRIVPFDATAAEELDQSDV